jgi:hypothetical protein
MLAYRPFIFLKALSNGKQWLAMIAMRRRFSARGLAIARRQIVSPLF